MTGALNLPNSNPTSDNQAARKKYVDEQVATRATPTDVSTAAGLRVLKAGDTMTGFLTLHANPTSDLQAATKKYVDTAVSGGTGGLVSKTYVDTADGLRVLKAGDTMTGTLNIAGTTNVIGVDTGSTGASIDVQASVTGIDSNAAYMTFHRPNKYAVRFGLDNDNKLKVGGWSMGNFAYEILNSNNWSTYIPNQASNDGRYVLKAGDTMTGNLKLPTYNESVTDNNHAVTKKYVDDGVSAATTAANTAKTTADNAATAAATANTNANTRVLKAGDTMTGDLTVQGKITASGEVTAYSDKRLKKNISDITNALNDISKLKGVSFERVSDNKKSIGVIAQDILEVIPEVVTEDKDGYLSVSYGNIVALLIEGIKELSNKVDNLEKQLNK
jgi:hypothetical protein